MLLRGESPEIIEATCAICQSASAKRSDGFAARLETLGAPNGGRTSSPTTSGGMRMIPEAKIATFEFRAAMGAGLHFYCTDKQAPFLYRDGGGGPSAFA